MRNRELITGVDWEMQHDDHGTLTIFLRPPSRPSLDPCNRYPTGLGALVVKKGEALSLLQSGKRYFSGGTVLVASAGEDWYRRCDVVYWKTLIP